MRSACGRDLNLELVPGSKEEPGVLSCYLGLDHPGWQFSRGWVLIAVIMKQRYDLKPLQINGDGAGQDVSRFERQANVCLQDGPR